MIYACCMPSLDRQRSGWSRCDIAGYIMHLELSILIQSTPACWLMDLTNIAEIYYWAVPFTEHVDKICQHAWVSEAGEGGGRMHWNDIPSTALELAKCSCRGAWWDMSHQFDKTRAGGDLWASATLMGEAFYSPTNGFARTFSHRKTEEKLQEMNALHTFTGKRGTWQMSERPTRLEISCKIGSEKCNLRA